MLKGIDEKGNLRNVKVSEDGELLIKGNGVEVMQTSDREVVLNASVLTLSTESQVVNINKKVTQISIANYSDTADITMTIGSKTYQIGAGLAIDFPINEIIESISLISNTADTKIQLVIKGVE